MTESRQPGLVRRELRWTGLQGLHLAEAPVWWEFSGAVLPPPLDRQDAAAIALIQTAMRHGCDLHLEGPVSRALLAHLEEFQAVWARWRPDLYRRVGLSADSVVPDDVPAGVAAVAAFSGGVDATFTLMRHWTNSAGAASRPVAAAVLIHGFDIPLSAEAGYEKAVAGARAALGPTGIPLTKVVTSWRKLCRDWEMEFGAGLAACLHQFRGRAAAGLVGSDEDYGSLVTPWGSHPVIFPLLSCGDFELVYDGGGYTRTEKVAAIARWGDAADHVRVCWEGPLTGRNCGRCEKCVRTKLNFMASGRPPPATLAGVPSMRQILLIKARNDVQVSYLSDILAAARANGIDEPWVRALAVVIRWRRMANPMRAGLKRLPGAQRARRALRRLASRRS